MDLEKQNKKKKTTILTGEVKKAMSENVSFKSFS